MLHQQFSGNVWAKNDPFWINNAPGTEWNCKCDIEETDDPCTDNSALGNPEPPRGLDGRPGETGEIFTKDVSYIAKQQGLRLSDAMQKQFPSLQKLIDTDTRVYRTDYYSDKGGLLITNRKRIEEGKINGNKLEIFEKEHKAGPILAKNNYTIEHRESIEGSFDIFIDGKPADLKQTRSHNNIGKYAKHAIEEQGAEYAVFSFETRTAHIIRVIRHQWSARHRKCLYYFIGEEVIYNNWE